MRKIAIAVSIALGLGLHATAQETQITWEMVTSSVDKSDKAVQDEKKSIKPATWLEQERVYTRLYYYDLAGVMPSVDATNLKLMKAGDPLSKETVGEMEVWKYKRIDFYLKDNKVVKWEYPAAFRPDPLMVSAASLVKADSLDPAGKQKAKIAERAKEVSTYLRIAGSMAFSTDDYKSSLKYFETVLTLNSLKSVNEVDTVLYNDCGVVAKLAGNKEAAVKYFLGAANLGYKSDILYNEASKLYLENKDTAKAISTLEAGIEKYNSTNMINELINIYLQTGKDKQALDYINKAIAGAPNNATYYFAKGALNDKLNSSAEAVAAYKKAIELDDKYADAYLNLGASYYNQGIKYFSAANDAKTDKLFEEQKALGEAEYRKAMPYLEKILQLTAVDKDTEQNAAISLKNIYYKLGMFKESKTIKEKYNL